MDRHRLLTAMGISTPALRILELPSSLQSHGELYFLVGNKRIAPQGLLHLGSQCPVDPERTAIFDFLPDKLLPTVRNLAEFAVMFVFDKWTGQTDKRQAVFVRDRSVTASLALRAYFTDHGQAFGGARWELRDWPLIGHAFQSRVYSSLDLSTQVEKALCWVECINEMTLLRAAEGVPSSWFAPPDHECLDILLAKLRQRQLNLRPLISRHLQELCAYVGFAGHERKAHPNTSR
jgi:hypothetical protein